MDNTVFLVLTILLHLPSFDFRKREGDDCILTYDRLPGICTTLANCKSAENNLALGIRPKVCAYTQNQTLICCPTNGLTSTTTTQRSANIAYMGNNERNCAYPPIAIKVERNEWPHKSWNKCIDLADSIFPCVKISMSANAPKDRFDTCQFTAVELIIGGEEAKVNEFPHVATLGYQSKENNQIYWGCGGTLISERWVMSAAHCVFNRQLGVTVSHIRLGGGSLNAPVDNERLFTITRIEKHPNYQAPSVYNDICLLMLNKEVQYSSSTRPACLHVGNQIKDNKAIAIGYGITEDEEVMSNTLMKVKLEKFEFEECFQKHPKGRKSANGVRNDTQICYGSNTEQKDTCKGDSGGALQIYNDGVHCTYTVIGITSIGKVCGVISTPGIYTRVSAFVPWIEKIVWPN